MRAGNRAARQADSPEPPRREILDVETAGMVTGVGGFLVAATQYFLPNAVNYGGSTSMGFIAMASGVTVWYRKRRQRLRQERSEQDRHEG